MTETHVGAAEEGAVARPPGERDTRQPIIELPTTYEEPTADDLLACADGLLLFRGSPRPERVALLLAQGFVWLTRGMVVSVDGQAIRVLTAEQELSYRWDEEGRGWRGASPMFVHTVEHLEAMRAAKAARKADLERRRREEAQRRAAAAGAILEEEDSHTGRLAGKVSLRPPGEAGVRNSAGQTRARRT